MKEKFILFSIPEESAQNMIAEYDQKGYVLTHMAAANTSTFEGSKMRIVLCFKLREEKKAGK